MLVPIVRRTWVLKGQTPLLRHRARHHRKVSVIGGLSISPRRRRLRLFLRWHPEANIGQREVIAFLGHLLRHLRGPVIIVWDRLNAHRSRAVRAYAEHRRRVTLELLPPYAPELNPVEGVWSNLKYHRLANHGIDDLAQLQAQAAEASSAIAERPRLLRSFIRATPLPIRLRTSVY